MLVALFGYSFLKWFFVDGNCYPQSPKRLCTESRNSLVEHNSQTPPPKQSQTGLSILKAKYHPLQATFARCDHLLQFVKSLSIYYFFANQRLMISEEIVLLSHIFCSPTVSNPVSGNEKCAVVGVQIFFSKVWSIL